MTFSLATRDSLLVEFQSDYPYKEDSPILPKKQINTFFDSAEQFFQQKLFDVVEKETGRLVGQTLKNPDLDKVLKLEWNVFIPLQKVIGEIWNYSWKIGQEHSQLELRRIGNFSSERELAEFADITIDESTFDPTRTKRDSSPSLLPRKKTGYQSTITPERIRGLKYELTPDEIKRVNSLTKSGMSRAVEQRSIQLAKDVDEQTLKEIKQHLIAYSSTDPNVKIDRKELEKRINLSLGRQAGRETKSLGGKIVVRAKTAIPGNRGFLARAKNIAATEISAAYSTARLESYLATGIEYVRFQSLEDDRVCNVCQSRNGTIHRIVDILSVNPRSVSNVAGRYVGNYDSKQYLIPVHSNCFPAGTKVSCEGNIEKNIEDIKIGDRVITASTKGSQKVYDLVRKKYSGNLLKFYFENGRTLTTTPDHPIWDGEKFIPAKAFIPGDNVWEYFGILSNSSNKGQKELHSELGENKSQIFKILGDRFRNTSWTFKRDISYTVPVSNRYPSIHEENIQYWSDNEQNLSVYNISTGKTRSIYKNVFGGNEGYRSNSKRIRNNKRLSKKSTNKTEHSVSTWIGSNQNSMDLRTGGKTRTSSKNCYRKNETSFSEIFNRKTQSESSRTNAFKQPNEQSRNQEKSIGISQRTWFTPILKQTLQSGKKKGSGKYSLQVYLGSQLCESVKPIKTGMGVRASMVSPVKREVLHTGFLSAETRSIYRNQRSYETGCSGENNNVSERVSEFKVPNYRPEEVLYSDKTFSGLSKLRITNVEEIPFEGTVYNLSVEEDEVYIANGIFVHNCRCQWIPIRDPEGYRDEGRDPAKRDIPPLKLGWVTTSVLAIAGIYATLTIANRAKNAARTAQQTLGRIANNELVKTIAEETIQQKIENVITPLVTPIPEVIVGVDINLNKANLEQLQSLGFTDKQIQAILEYRKQGRYFTSLEDLEKIKGIGKATIEKVRFVGIKPKLSDLNSVDSLMGVLGVSNKTAEEILRVKDGARDIDDLLSRTTLSRKVKQNLKKKLQQKLNLSQDQSQPLVNPQRVGIGQSGSSGSQSVKSSVSGSTRLTNIVSPNTNTSQQLNQIRSQSETRAKQSYSIAQIESLRSKVENQINQINELPVLRAQTRDSTWKTRDEIAKIEREIDRIQNLRSTAPDEYNLISAPLINKLESQLEKLDKKVAKQEEIFGGIEDQIAAIYDQLGTVLEDVNVAYRTAEQFQDRAAMNTLYSLQNRINRISDRRLVEKQAHIDLVKQLSNQISEIKKKIRAIRTANTFRNIRNRPQE